MNLRQRHDDTRRKLEMRADRPGHPLHATVSVTVLGRYSLGRSAPQRLSFGVDLLFGQASEAHLLRQIQDAIESTYYSDIHQSQRLSQEATIATRQSANNAEHAEWEAKRSELAFTSDRPLAMAPKKTAKRGKR